jgi:hypothetical protein
VPAKTRQQQFDDGNFLADDFRIWQQEQDRTV